MNELADVIYDITGSTRAADTKAQAVLRQLARWLPTMELTDTQYGYAVRWCDNYLARNVLAPDRESVESMARDAAEAYIEEVMLRPVHGRRHRRR